MKVVVGVDIGQQVDPTALAVTQVEWREPVLGSKLFIEPTDHYLVRHLERMPLKTPYPDVAMRVQVLVANVRRLVYAGTLKRDSGEYRAGDAPSIEVYVDATGVGQPIVDMLRAVGVKVTGVYFTSGDKRVEVIDERTRERRVNLGKAYMVSKMQALMQTNRLHFPGTAEARALAEELSTYEIKVDTNANDTYGAFKTGAHDDLVTAVGLTVQSTPPFRGMASTDGHSPQAVPKWAGPFGEARLPGLGPMDNHPLDRFGK